MLTEPIKGRRVGGFFEPTVDPRDLDPSVPGKPWLTWETGSFEVPWDTPDERVQEKAAFYRNVYGQKIENRGKILCWPTEVMGIEGPYLDDHPVASLCVDPDRKRYILRALVKREPRSFNFIVPNEMAAAYLADGYRPKD